MKVISLGWGVQSFALAAMSAVGELPPVEAAIHADTGHERRATYDFARRWTPWLEEHGVRVVTVKGDATDAIMDEWGGVFIPAFTSREDGAPSGLLHRQCTHRWKIAPIRRWLQEHRDGRPVEIWLGITLDEVARMKASDVRYIANVYPFVETLDRPWTRGMVVRWLQANGLEVPSKSACVFCPFHDQATWRDIKLSGDGDWQMAIAIDQAIRHKRPGYLCYLASVRQPLSEIDFRNAEDFGQLSLWPNECSGLCGV